MSLSPSPPFAMLWVLYGTHSSNVEMCHNAKNSETFDKFTIRKNVMATRSMRNNHDTKFLSIFVHFISLWFISFLSFILLGREYMLQTKMNYRGNETRYIQHDSDRHANKML